MAQAERMNATRVRGTMTLVLAVLVALLVGVIGLWSVLADSGPKESRTMRWLMTGVISALGATTVGALVPRRWYLAVITAWGPLFLGAMGLVAKLAHGGPIPYWSFLATTLLGLPALAVLFGYVGRRLRGPQRQQTRRAS